ncbi:MAG TPA: heavy-metal-associated domain-containing protein [Bacteroidales bacterium]
METLKFKTNLKCGGCIAAITPGLEKLEGVGEWKVDLTVPDRILEVETSPDKAASILEAVKKAGYEISQL